MTQLLSIDDDFHAALKLMSAEPSEKRGMKAIVQDALNDDKQFVKVLADARRKIGAST
ncbi:hypothetical protein OAU44_00245 [bacterium]|nr:hypothetical protein [bacterium]